MKVNEFVSKLKHIATLPTTYYSVAGGKWAKWNGSAWNFDCVILVKAILWGWCENKNHPHGGANYGSNGVYDDDANNILNRCYNISKDFSKLEVGELLWTGGHVGVYIGEGKVVEATGAWERKVVISNVNSDGARHRNGVYSVPWKKHGKLKYIDYSENKKSNDSKSEIIHIVKKGETLFKIANMYGTTVNELVKLNNLSNPDLILINQKLYIKERMESLPNNSIFYTVKSGDTLWKIANSYNMSVQKLYDDNKSVIGKNPDYIEIGMKLVIKP